MFLRAYAWVWAARLSLWFLPFQTVYKFTKRFRHGRTPPQPLSKQNIYKLTWAVAAAARRVPWATCLTQALAAQIMLGRRGLRTQLQLGIKKSQPGKMDAHAWLERNGEVLIGMIPTFSQLTRLPPLEGECE